MKYIFLTTMMCIAFVMHSNAQWDSVGLTGFTQNPIITSDITFDHNTGKPYVVTHERPNGQDKVRLYSYDGTSWNTEKVLNGRSPQITFSKNNRLVLTYLTGSGGLVITERVGTNWQVRFSNPSSSHKIFDLVAAAKTDSVFALCHLNNQVYIIGQYIDANDQSTLVSIPGQNFGVSTSTFSMTFSKYNNEIYLAYDSANRVCAMKKTANSWAQVDPAGSFPGESPQIISNKGGEIAIAYHYGKTYLRKLDNSSWVFQVGTGYGIGFKAVTAVAYNPNDECYYWWARNPSNNNGLVCKYDDGNGYILLNNINASSMGQLEGGINPVTYTAYSVISDNDRSAYGSVKAWGCTTFPLPSTQNNILDIEACNGDDLLLNGTGNGIVKWYNQATGGNVVSNNKNLQLNNVSTTRSYFVEDQVCGSYSLRTQVNVTVNPLPTDLGINQQGLDLAAKQNNVSYQWLDCSNAYTEIANATAKTFAAPQSGSYAVELTTNKGCVDTSDCVTIARTASVGTVNIETELLQGNNFIEIRAHKPIESIAVYDMHGKEILNRECSNKKARIETEFCPGIYLVIINHTTESLAKRLYVK